uniref:Nanos-type domain-containing protein n=1 Tax=Anopheles farauti TaxID=69004 RepID=A0A182QHM1_9DIPT
MYTINKETLELAKQEIVLGEHPVASGRFVKSKLTNRLVWHGSDTRDPVRDLEGALGISFNTIEMRCQPLIVTGSTMSPTSVSSSMESPSGSEQSVQSMLSGGSPEQDMANRQQMWKHLVAAADTNGEDCEFCAVDPAGSPFYPKHRMHSPDGTLICPVLLESETLKFNEKQQVRAASKGSRSMKQYKK